MHTIDVTVVNELGLHARPASKLAQTASRFQSNITIHKDGIPANAKSILGLLTLACPQNSVLRVEADGPDAEAAVAAIAALFASGFDET